MNANKYKEKSIKEFTKTVKKYETEDAGIYKLCRKDCPDIFEELGKETFHDLLDAGCGTAMIIFLLSQSYPECHYTGLDLH